MSNERELAELKQEVSEVYRALYRLIEQLKYMRWSPKEFVGFNTVLQPKPKPKKKMKAKRARR